MLKHLKRRSGLLGGGTIGIIVGAIAQAYIAPLSAALLGWCAGVVVYLAIDFWVAAHATVKTMKSRAAAVEEGRLTVLFITVGVGVASLAAIIVDLGPCQRFRV